MAPTEKTIAQVEALCDDLQQWVEQQSDPLGAIRILRYRYGYDGDCCCQSYHRRTGEHIEACSLYEEK